jgi:hypothetical protein
VTSVVTLCISPQTRRENDTMFGLFLNRKVMSTGLHFSLSIWPLVNLAAKKPARDKLENLVFEFITREKTKS